MIHLLLFVVFLLSASVAEAATCGKASWYASGRLTASGERFHPGGHTAAHRQLPFGHKLKVTNPHNGKSVWVRINDRGPWVKNKRGHYTRDLDLSRGASLAIGHSGVGRVCYE